MSDRLTLLSSEPVAGSSTPLTVTRLYFGLRPRIVGVYDNKECAYDETSLDLKTLKKNQKQSGTVRNYDK